MSRVFVLGHHGMLGHMVAAFLHAEGFDVVTSEARYSGGPTAADPLLLAVRESGCPWVINALGAIPQKTLDHERLFRANTQFPLHLLQALGRTQRLLHASSDCVFSGSRGSYRTTDAHDADSIYGLSKSLGETVALDPRVLCLRVSIVGPEPGPGRGLLGWFLRQPGPVSGFTNHHWNGITTLEWARCAVEVMRGGGPSASGVIQAGSPEPVTKEQLLRLFAGTFHHPIPIHPVAADSAVDRTLVPDWVRPPLQTQLLELRNWMSRSSPAAPASPP